MTSSEASGCRFTKLSKHDIDDGNKKDGFILKVNCRTYCTVNGEQEDTLRIGNLGMHAFHIELSKK